MSTSSSASGSGASEAPRSLTAGAARSGRPAYPHAFPSNRPPATFAARLEAKATGRGMRGRRSERMAERRRRF